MTDKYILEGKKAVPCDDLQKWGERFETTRRHVGDTTVGDVRISTVFLGLDHSWGGGRPLIFETMIFGGAYDDYQERYSTWEEAERGHAQAVQKVAESQ